MKTLSVQPDNLFFTADTHFGHRHEKLLTHRRYVSTDEMDANMVVNWNNTVPKDGVVFHLGDVSFHNRARTQELLGQLNGTIHLITGNHDKGMRFGTRMATNDIYREIKVLDPAVEVTFAEQKMAAECRIVLMHYPLHSWNRMHYGAWHLHGHSHGSMAGFGRRQDVGWDVFHGPISYQQLKSLVGGKAIRSYDHHQPH